jgi:hypothetical protein
MCLQVEQYGFNLKTKDASTVTSLEASLVLKQQLEEAFQSVPHTYRWLFVTIYYKPILSLPYFGKLESY